MDKSSLAEQKEIDEIITEHNKNKGLRVLQNHLANSLTKLIHGEKELENAVNYYPKSKKFIMVATQKLSEDYDMIQFHTKDRDKKYIIEIWPYFDFEKSKMFSEAELSTL